MGDIPTYVSCVTIATNALELIKSEKPNAREWKFFPKANDCIGLFNAFQMSTHLISNIKWTVSAPSMDLKCDILKHRNCIEIILKQLSFFFRAIC